MSDFDPARYDRLMRYERDRLKRVAQEKAGFPILWFQGYWREPTEWLAGDEPEPLPPPGDTPDAQVILHKDLSSAACLKMARSYARRVERAELEKKQARDAVKSMSKRAKQAMADEAQEKRVAGDANGFALRMPDAEDLKRSGRRRK